MIHFVLAIVGWMLHVPWKRLLEWLLCLLALKLLFELMNRPVF